MYQHQNNFTFNKVFGAMLLNTHFIYNMRIYN